MPADALVNGSFSRSIDSRDRGLAYGDGLFETIKINAGHPEFLSLHLRRLQWGCARLGIDCDVSVIESDIEKILPVASTQAAVLKIIITRESGGRGYQPDANAGFNRILRVEGLTSDYAVEASQGVAVRLCDTRLGINPQLAGIKHLSRLENVLARAEWRDKAITEGLMFDSDGRLVEGTMSNVFIVKDKVLLTPRLHRCGVNGVIRQLLIEQLAPSLKLSCDTADVVLEDIYQAEEVFICNSLMGIVPVVTIGCHTKTIGDITRSLQQSLQAVRNSHA
ncbi:aminodeoxychorismate lyase [Oceanicoccus sagamiensis]|uniref:Aminodeoxychorismate lyase n=1 Tax=Oceanicoccus sagamiensis TaxID=716816 RepID=A0A1X9NBW3_9GAMM|nr:aminodeoxychorismate lyase [Oceanicoccus sagamiensis]ARN75538.1 aminodeoxychorismate lyase [Oceanicoccus sagamiensis]